MVSVDGHIPLERNAPCRILKKPWNFDICTIDSQELPEHIFQGCCKFCKQKPRMNLQGFSTLPQPKSLYTPETRAE